MYIYAPTDCSTMSVFHQTLPLGRITRTIRKELIKFSSQVSYKERAIPTHGNYKIISLQSKFDPALEKNLLVEAYQD